MAGTRRLRLQVSLYVHEINERLEAAVEEIFGLVEQTIAGYEDEAVRSKTEIDELKKQLEQLTVLKPGVMLYRADQKVVSEEELPLLEPCVIKMEQEQAQVKWEQVDQRISPDLDADTYDAEDAHPQSEQTTNFEMLPSSTAVTASVNESLDQEWIESDGPSSPHQNQTSEVVVELEQPLIEEKSCHYCGESFRTHTQLIRHLEKSHKHKPFKCLKCNKQFNRKEHLVLHGRVHTGEKPFSCELCGKTFTQNSNRIVHMRRHHITARNVEKSLPVASMPKTAKGNKKKSGRKKHFCCKTCGNSFYTDSDLKLHTEVHESWKLHISEKIVQADSHQACESQKAQRLLNVWSQCNKPCVPNRILSTI